MFDKNQLAGLMKKAQEMQDNIKKTQEEISQMEVEGESGAGLVKLTINGKHDVVKLWIDPSLIVASEKEMLEDLVAAAVNAANRKLEQASEEKMEKIAAGIPGMPNLGGKFPF